MYDELVALLRKKYDKAPMVMEAADAIEELDKLLDGVSADNDSLCEKIERMVIAGKPRWIPVTERLPKAERKAYWICTNTGYQCECRWTNNRFGIKESDEWGWSIFDIPQYQKVVAWMPLPKPYEPPKEERA